MAFFPNDLSPEYIETTSTHRGISGQKEITRTRVFVALGFVQNTVGAPEWLELLNEVEFQTLLTDILPAVEHEKKRRGLT